MKMKNNLLIAAHCLYCCHKVKNNRFVPYHYHHELNALKDAIEQAGGGTYNDDNGLCREDGTVILKGI